MSTLILQGIFVLFVTIIYFGINVMGVIKIISIYENEDISSLLCWFKIISINIILEVPYSHKYIALL